MKWNERVVILSAIIVLSFGGKGVLIFQDSKVRDMGWRDPGSPTPRSVRGCAGARSIVILKEFEIYEESYPRDHSDILYLCT